MTKEKKKVDTKTSPKKPTVEQRLEAIEKDIAELSSHPQKLNISKIKVV